MKGFKESLLTRVLCIVYPEDSSRSCSSRPGMPASARSLARCGASNFPTQGRTHMTIGRLAVWSNDLILGLVGAEDFKTQQHAAAFLWWAKDQA